MKIGIIGVGNIGTTLAQRLPRAGHDVLVANSRGPETIEADVTSAGARAVTAQEAATEVDVLILSIPLARIPDLAPVVAAADERTVVIDTSNYYPARDGQIEALDDGQVESEWVVEQLGRSIVKAWNAVLADTLAAAGSGDAGRIAIPVAGDDERASAVARQLVEETGLDAVDAGSLSESWRQQPGSPVYCTSLTAEQIPSALAAAQKDRLPRRRDLAIDVITNKVDDPSATVDAAFLTQLNRLLYR
ncbi:NADPH-dependent F420 reductase [Mobilicoccus caccae]|uniref:3-hydroxyisobutyrate dehydrogenase n=1 Tax=Mobilicoccus caccae TaxID=1859295 RepID=A0ABQ6IN06_9MICO|nr:3-hydroxyisobutyrate dehydrogenase [Mobilicoccus caccae]